MAAIDFPRILSRPLRVHWAGWETTTYQLQKSGWQLSAEQDIRRGYMRIAMRHGGVQMMAITDRVEFPFMDLASPHYDPRAFEQLDRIVLNVNRAMGYEIFIHEDSPAVAWRMDNDNWSAIDAEPRYSTRALTRLEDFAHFAGPLIRTNEIIVPEESVPDLLERILKLQQPARTERIREELRGERRPEQRFHAQIISLKDVA